MLMLVLYMPQTPKDPSEHQSSLPTNEGLFRRIGHRITRGFLPNAADDLSSVEELLQNEGPERFKTVINGQPMQIEVADIPQSAGELASNFMQEATEQLENGGFIALSRPDIKNTRGTGGVQISAYHLIMAKQDDRVTSFRVSQRGPNQVPNLDSVNRDTQLDFAGDRPGDPDPRLTDFGRGDSRFAVSRPISKQSFHDSSLPVSQEQGLFQEIIEATSPAKLRKKMKEQHGHYDKGWTTGGETIVLSAEYLSLLQQLKAAEEAYQRAGIEHD